MTIFFEDGAKGKVISEGNFTNFTSPVPARVKLKKSWNFYYKKISSWLIILICLGMPSFYHISPA